MNQNFICFLYHFPVLNFWACVPDFQKAADKTRNKNLYLWVQNFNSC